LPYEWITSRSPDETGHSIATLRLRPHRSLPRRGFVFFIAATAVMLALPLLAALGTLVLWGLLPFIAATVGGIWWGLNRSYRDGETAEVLTLTRDRITLAHRAPDRSERHWQANPYWVSVQIYPSGGPVPDYLTLKGGGREVELGAFLTAGERRALHRELAGRIAGAPR